MLSASSHYQKMLVSGIQYAVGDLAADDSPSEK